MTEEKKENIFTPKRTVKFFIVDFIALAVVCIILWPLLDLLFSKIFDTPYEGWSVMGGIVRPIIFSLVLTIVEFTFWNFFHKKK